MRQEYVRTRPQLFLFASICHNSGLHKQQATRKDPPVPDEIDWVGRLRGEPEVREAALNDLRQVLLRGISHSLSRRGGGEAFAEDIVQEALLKIMDSLDSFEGRSRFTTWAMTVATRIGISELRRRHFQNVSLDQITGTDDLKFELAVDPGATPAQDNEREELLVQFRDLIETQLTEKQRKVMQAALSGMPMEEIARRLDSNRNAVYKVFHDARKRLRASFESRGISASDVKAVLG